MRPWILGDVFTMEAFQDGYVTGKANSYPPTSGTSSDSTGTLLYIGQRWTIEAELDVWYVNRTFLKIDTSAIPSTATITYAKVSIYGYADYSIDAEFDVVLTKWTGNVPINTADFPQSDGVSYGVRGTVAYGWTTTGYNDINVTNYDLITKNGDTLICIRTSREIAAFPTPLGLEYVIGYATEQDGTSKDPYLEVTYTTNNIPTNDQLTLDLTGASYKGTKTLLAGKQDYTFVYKCSDADGVTDLSYAEIRLDYATKNVILRATRGTGDAWTFSEQSDPSNYVTLNTGGSSHSTSANQKTFNFLVTVNWNWDDASETLGVRAYVIDSLSGTDQDDYSNIFGVENDLSTASLAVSDYRCNPSQTLTFSGYWYYEGTSINPPDGDYQVKVKLSGVQKGSTDTTLVSGYFSISDVTAESTVGSYSYTVDATYMLSAGAFSAVIVDRLQVQSYTVSDARVNVNDNVNIDVLVWFDYDNTVCATATITINGYSAAHQGLGVYRITRTSSSATSVTYNNVACSTETSYGITTVDQNTQSTTVVWDGLAAFNLQTVEYLGSGQFRYRAQVKYAYDSGLVSGASLNVSLPSGSIIGQLTSNSTGWIAFVLTQSNATEAGSYKIFGVNDNNYGITYTSANVTFVMRNWTLSSKDVDGNILSSTTITVKNASTTVFNSGADTIRIPEDTFNITIAWLGIQVNSTENLAISGNTVSNFTCLAYPYIYGGTRYWAASNATISSALWNNNILTIQFSGSVANYILKTSCIVKPSYVLNCTYDMDTDWTTILTLTHYANTTIKVGYPDWGGGAYVHKTDKRMTAASWDGQFLTLTFTGSSGEVGQVEVYCGSKGAPTEYTGFTTGSYSSSSKLFIGTYSFASDKTVSVKWEIEGPGTITGEGGDQQYQPHLLISVNIVIDKLLKAGKNVTGIISVKWSGATIIYVYDVQFDVNGTWFKVEGMPLKLVKARDSVQGEYEMLVSVRVPFDAKPGDYLIPCNVIFRTEAAQTVTVGGMFKFAVEGAPTTIPEYLTLTFLAIFGLIFIVAMSRKKR